jgi:hypothetical protein
MMDSRGRHGRNVLGSIHIHICSFVDFAYRARPLDEVASDLAAQR